MLVFEVEGKKCVLVENPDGTYTVYLDDKGKVRLLCTRSSVEEAHRTYRLQVNLMIEIHLVKKLKKEVKV